MHFLIYPCESVCERIYFGTRQIITKCEVKTRDKVNLRVTMEVLYDVIPEKAEFMFESLYSREMLRLVNSSTSVNSLLFMLLPLVPPRISCLYQSEHKSRALSIGCVE